MRISMSNVNRSELILKAANEVFFTTGFEKSTVQEIANKAGVGKGTIYEYFQSKEALFVEMIQNDVSYILDDIVKSLEQIETIEELIDSQINLSLYHIEQHSHKVHILYDDLTKVSKEVYDWLAGKKIGIIDQISALIQQFIDNKELRDVNPKVVAWSIAEITRLAFVYKIMYKEEDIETILNEKKEILLYGCRV